MLIDSNFIAIIIKHRNNANLYLKACPISAKNFLERNICAFRAKGANRTLKTYQRPNDKENKKDISIPIDRDS